MSTNLRQMKWKASCGSSARRQRAPIFPGVTDVEAIIRRVWGICNLVWLENLNLRGDHKAHILAWVHKRHPELDPLYDAIYRRGDRTYWSELDARLRKFAATEDLPYLRAEDNRMADFGEPPIVVNYFYHEQVKKSARGDLPFR